MKLLVDNQLPTALARFLSSRAETCVHVLDIDLGQAADREIWQHALAHGYVLITKDQDFLHMNGPHGPGI